MTQVKLLSMTAILTALIWASADSLVNEAVSVRVLFEPVPAPGATDMVVESNAANEPYEVQISGPRALAEDIRALSPLRVRLHIPDRPTGSATIPLDRATLKREMTEQWNEFEKLTVVSVRPDTLPVLVDHWVTKDVDVVLQRLALAYDVEPQLERGTVTVRMRESWFDKVPKGERLQLDLSADAERLLKGQAPGQSVTIPVRLDGRPFGPAAVLTPDAISITATVKAQRSTAQISTVPILIAVSFANLEKPYRPVTRDGTPLSLETRTITVTGPTDAVTRLQSGATRAYGLIHLKQEAMEGLNQLMLMTPEYHLPPGIELAEEPAPVEFKLIDSTSTLGNG